MNTQRMHDIADDIIEALRGQCVNTIDSELNRHGFDISTAPPELLRMIDDGVFCCEMCGWYCDADEMSETDMLCDECDDNY